MVMFAGLHEPRWMPKMNLCHNLLKAPYERVAAFWVDDPSCEIL